MARRIGAVIGSGAVLGLAWASPARAGGPDPLQVTGTVAVGNTITITADDELCTSMTLSAVVYHVTGGGYVVAGVATTGGTTLVPASVQFTIPATDEGGDPIEEGDALAIGALGSCTAPDTFTIQYTETELIVGAASQVTTTTAPPATTTSPAPPTTSPSPPSTAAAVAARELPRTGAGDGPLAAAGVVLVAGGLTVVAAARRRSAAATA